MQHDQEIARPTASKDELELLFNELRSGALSQRSSVILNEFMDALKIDNVTTFRTDEMRLDIQKFYGKPIKIRHSLFVTKSGLVLSLEICNMEHYRNTDQFPSVFTEHDYTRLCFHIPTPEQILSKNEGEGEIVLLGGNRLDEVNENRLVPCKYYYNGYTYFPLITANGHKISLSVIIRKKVL